MKKLLEIQRGYFEILKKYFGHFYDEAKRNNVSPQAIAEDIMRHPTISRLITENIDVTFGNEVEDFWRRNYNDLLFEVSKLSGFRIYYGGDLSPVNSSIVNRTGLYADTIIIPDPTLRTIGTGVLSQAALPHVRLYLLLKSAIKMLEYEQLIFANTPQPIAIVFPSEFFMKDKEFGLKIAEIAQLKTVKFFNENMIISQPDFQSWGSVFEKLNNLEDLEKIIKNKEAFLFDSNLPINSFDKQIGSIIEYSDKNLKRDVDNLLGGRGMNIVFNSIFGRVAQAEWHLAKSEILSSFPVQDAAVSWSYLKWDMRNNGNAFEKSFLPSYLLEDKFLMLGNVPIEALLKLRENGELQDLRECIGKEITRDLASDKPEETVKQIEYNLREELKRHQEKVRKLDEDFRKSLKIRVSSILATVGFGVLGIVGSPWLALQGIALGGSSIFEISKSYDKKNEEEKRFKKSFWGFYADTL